MRAQSAGRRPPLRTTVLAGLLAFAAGAAGATGALVGVATPASASPESAAVPFDRFALDAAAVDDALLAASAGEPAASARARLWTRPEAEALAARLRDRLALAGRLDASVRLVVVPGPGSTPGVARLGVEGESPDRAAEKLPLLASVRVVSTSAVSDPRDKSPDPATAAAGYAEIFERGAASYRAPAGPASTPGDVSRHARDTGALAAIGSGVAAVRDRLLEEGRYAADVAVDSIAAEPGSMRVYLAVTPGAAVTLERVELEGAKTTRPNAAAAIAGLRRGDPIRPSRLDAARDRLQSSDLFASVGVPRVLLGSAPDLARLVIPVEEARASRFDGVLGAAPGGGVTGAIDLALENIAGTGRAAGLRWIGMGESGKEYAAHYREPALFGRPLDASISLEAHLVDSLFTATRWSAGLGARAGARGRVGVSYAHTGTTYGGLARGTNGASTVRGDLAWRALQPAANPRAGVSLRLAGEAGRRTETIPGLPDESRGLARGSLLVEGAVPRGPSRAVYASMRGDATSLGGPTYPAEELYYVGGNEGLRGHRERAFGGDRIAAFTLEHRWLTDPAGGRVFLFADAAYHELDRPLAAGSSAPGSASAALARTELSTGWDFGYGAGLRARVAAGLVGVELGLRPGASLGAATVHLRYGSRW